MLTKHICQISTGRRVAYVVFSANCYNKSILWDNSKFWPSWNEMKLYIQINDWNSKISIGKTEVLVISLACLAQLNPTLESVKLWSGIFNLDVLSTLLLFILMIDIWISKFLLVYYFVIGWNQRISKFPLHWLSKKNCCTHAHTGKK